MLQFRVVKGPYKDVRKILLYSLYRIDLSRVWNIFFKYC